MDDGRRGEQAAHRYLLRRGWRPVARNWSGAGGELDIVMMRRGILAIVEVKTRRDPAELEEPIRLAQRARIIRAASVFASRRAELAALAIRFDLITVDRSRRPARIVHIEGAFSPADPQTGAWPHRPGRRWTETSADEWV